MPKKPTKAESTALIQSFARYLALLDRAPLPAQQRAYGGWSQLTRKLASKYPGIDFDSPTTLANLEHAARVYLNQHPMMGSPGFTY